MAVMEGRPVLRERNILQSGIEHQGGESTPLNDCPYILR